MVSQKAIVDLPLNGRNPLTLPGLEPGVMQRSNGGSGTGVHVNGSRDMAQFRAEAFNAVNHANLDNPRDASVGSNLYTSPAFGQICCAAVSTASARPIIQTGESGRAVQLGPTRRAPEPLAYARCARTRLADLVNGRSSPCSCLFNM